MDVDRNARLWTVQDAKYGDVLVDTEDNNPFIFRYTCGNNIWAHCGIVEDYYDPSELVLVSKRAIPATQSQKETLFRAMEDADYKLDSKRKELIKIEHRK